jgi:dihydrofolate reductase
MGRIVYGLMQSLDGFIAGTPGGPQLPPPGEGLHRVFNDIMRDTAVVVYGRTMYEIMRAWETLDTQPDTPAAAMDFAPLWRETPKVVVSTTLKEIGPNARLVSDNVEAELRKLKAETDGKIEVAGQGLAASVGRMGLIDEYRVFFHPIVLGGGKPFFASGLPLNLKLMGTETLPEGVVLLRYEPIAQS